MNEHGSASQAGTFLNEDKSLACIHCGLCLSSCPTYLETGNENDSPRGRIYQMRAVQSGELPLSDETVRHFDLCLGCRACESACPSGVEYGSLLESTREHVEKNYRRGFLDSFLRRVLIEKVFPYSRRVEYALKPAILSKRFGIDRFLPDALRRFTDLVPDRLKRRSPLPEFSPSTAPRRLGAVGFVSGCVMDVMFNQTNWNTIHLLNLAGYDVFTPPNQSCCGALHAHSGKMPEARSTALQLLKSFTDKKLDHVVTNAAGCGSTLKDYPHLFEDTGEAGGFSDAVVDLTEILAGSSQFLELLDSKMDTRRPVEVVTYHQACHLVHAQQIATQPLELIRRVAGTSYVELPESDVCCGSAGSYNLTEPQMAKRLGRRKADCIATTNASVVVSSNPGCLLQIAARLETKSDSKVRCLHIADFLFSAIEPMAS